MPLSRVDASRYEELLADKVDRVCDLARQHRGYFQSPERVIGKKLKRGLARSGVLTPRMLTSEKLVKRGSEVLILARGGEFSVRMKGKALRDGGLGERIEVRNSSSGRKLSAIVIQSGMVEVSY